MEVDVLYWSKSYRHIGLESFTFSGGEVQVKVDGTWSPDDSLTIQASLESSHEVMELLMTVDAVRRRFGANTPIKLVCPYLPYARQDRVMNAGEALGIRVMCDLLNSLRFDSVEVWDVHSDVPLALLDRVVHHEQNMFVQRVPVNTPDVIYVAPDAGSMKKVLKAAQGYGRDMITAEKVRDTKIGEITGTKVHSENLGDRPVLILDDICDGGRTFTELAKELRKITTGKIYLYVTHGIFSKGFEPFEGLIDHIYVANPFKTVDLKNPLVTKLNLEY
jgi:ribose-phosphate pyrophosphokinase